MAGKAEILLKVRDLIGKEKGRVSGLHNEDLSKLFDAFFNALEALCIEGGCSIPGFGIFKQKDRAARVATNPKTGERLQIPAQRVLKFTPSPRMRDLVKERG